MKQIGFPRITRNLKVLELRCAHISASEVDHGYILGTTKSHGARFSPEGPLIGIRCVDSSKSKPIQRNPKHILTNHMIKTLLGHNVIFYHTPIGSDLKFNTILLIFR